MKDRKMISADSLKWIALITMFIDHIGAGILKFSEPFTAGDKRWIYLSIRAVGRIAFPIFCFLLVEGYMHTRSKWKYLFNLLIFALISEIPFDLLFRRKIFAFDYQNVFFTLAIGLIVIWVMELLEEKISYPLVFIPQIMVVSAGAYLAYFLRTDYDNWGIVLIALLFLTGRNRRLQCMSAAAFIILSSLTGMESELEAFAALAFVLVAFYNGQRNNKINKYVYYCLYPGHLLLYSGLRYLLFTLMIL